MLVDDQLQLIEQVEVELKLLDQRLAELADGQEQERLLIMLPGFGYPVALNLLAALGDLSRFRDGDHAASYLGLVLASAIMDRSPRRAIGRHVGCLPRRRSRPSTNRVRWGVFFHRLCRRKNRNVAIVATARKLVTIAFLILKNREPYRYAMPAPTEKKLAELRAPATGERRFRRGQAKRPDLPRPVGVRAKNVRLLREFYQPDGLPASKTPDNLPAASNGCFRKRARWAWQSRCNNPVASCTASTKPITRQVLRAGGRQTRLRRGMIQRPETFF